MKKILFIAVLTIAYLLVPAWAEMRAQYTAPDSCLKLFCPHDNREFFNPDSVKVDSCLNSTTLGKWYIKRGVYIAFDNYIFSPKPISINETRTWEEIDSKYDETREGFRFLEEKLGKVIFYRDPDFQNDSLHLLYPGFLINFSNYLFEDSVYKWINKISEVHSCFLLHQPNFLIVEEVIKPFQNLIIFPIPASDKLNIKISNSNDFIETNIKIVNYLGTVLHSYKLNSCETQLDVSHLPNGLYYVIMNNIVRSFIIYR